MVVPVDSYEEAAPYFEDLKQLFPSLLQLIEDELAEDLCQLVRVLTLKPQVLLTAV